MSRQSEVHLRPARPRRQTPRKKRYDIRDDVGARTHPPGLAGRSARSFTLERRTVRGRRRYATLGSADALTVPEARREARRLIAAFTETVKNGGGPRTPGHPMDAFADEFLDRQARHWKPRTRETNAYIVRKYILPAFGNMTVDAITGEQVRDWFASMSERPGVANRAMPVLSMMMRMAELWGYRAHNSNPCRNTRRYRMKPMERFLTAEEMARLNAVLTRDEFWCPNVVAIVRLLMLTGCRFGEKSPPSNGTGYAAGASTFPTRSPARARSGCRRLRAPSSTPSRDTARIARICFPARPPTRPIDTIAVSTGTASAARRACPACGCMTCAIAGRPPPP